MALRTILRLPRPRDALRIKAVPPKLRRTKGPPRDRQGERLGPSFRELEHAVERAGGIELAEDPTGIAPERALVFETAGPIQNFARAAGKVGIEVITEIELGKADVPEGFTAGGDGTSISLTLYSTMPTIASAKQILALWKAHQENKPAPRGTAPWWNLFDLLVKIRTWEPQDRLSASARATIEERLPPNDDEPVKIEFEIWPSADAAARATWRAETEAKIIAKKGRVLHPSSISEDGFVYEALLAELPAGIVRAMLTDPNAPQGLAWIKGVQFILPQTIAQTIPDMDDGEQGDQGGPILFDRVARDTPLLAVLLDGVPVPAHPVLDGAIIIEDVHDLVPRSLVENRHHATGMASLIVRGDLQGDGNALPNTRLVCVPIAIDQNDGKALSPSEKLFVDIVHVALTKLFLGDDALAPHAFVVNLSMGITERRYAGQISSLARLLDWWAYEHGVLFVISAGNIPEPLVLTGQGQGDFIAADSAGKRTAVRQAIRNLGHARCLMAPAEALNGLTVGAISRDLVASVVEDQADLVRLEDDSEYQPAVSSAIGLGAFRTIKPDVLKVGGSHYVRATAEGGDTKLKIFRPPNAGLVVASPWPHIRQGRKRTIGTSGATALTTRAILLSASTLMGDGGPYAGRELSRKDLALLTRALAVNAAHWPEDAFDLYRSELDRLGEGKSFRAKEEVARHYGHGVLDPARMQESPANGMTMVGLGEVRKDQAKIFDLPLPASMSGDSIPRSMRITLAWFTPTSCSRSRYRLAALEAVAADSILGVDEEEDKGWGLLLRPEGLDEKIIGRGSVWSRRLVHHRLACPAYAEECSVPIRIQARDASGGGLRPNLDIRFAIAVTLEVEAEVQYDIHQEIRNRIEPRVRP